jgi:hypothetical protein
LTASVSKKKAAFIFQHSQPLKMAAVREKMKQQKEISSTPYTAVGFE